MVKRIPPPASSQQGIALIYVIFLSVIMVMLLSTAVSYTTGSMRAGRHELTKDIQAINVARAGLQQANFWFVNQTVQPVHQAVGTSLWPDMAFFPLYNTDPTVRQTDDQNCTGSGAQCSGLVQDINLNPPAAGSALVSPSPPVLYGHILVLRQNTNNEPLASGTTTNDLPYAAHDVSYLRTLNTGINKGAGVVWRVTSYGYVYIRNDLTTNADGTFTIPYNHSPNRIIDQTAAQVEFERLAVNVPTAAVSYDQGTLTISATGRIMNTSTNLPGISYSGTGLVPIGVTPTPNSNVQAKPQYSNTPSQILTTTGVFSEPQNELMGLADQLVTQVSDLKQPLPTMGILFINGNATFDVNTPLVGGGILYVNGNLTLSQDANGSFMGVIYVTGNLVVQGANYISGAVVVRGNTTIGGTSDIAEVDYNPSIISIVRTRLGNYRPDNLTFKLLPV